MKNPLITIAIPAFNCERTIQKAVTSALMQTYKNLEIIAVDDGSTDNTWEILSKFDDNRLRCLRFSQNKGTAAARNAIIEEAHGDYIAFFDSDDISYLNRIETQYESLSAYENKSPNDLIISLCSFNRIDVDGKSTFIQSPGYERELFGNDYALNEIGLISATSIGHTLTKYFFKITDPFYFKGTSILLTPKSTFQIIGYYDEFFRRCQDTDWNIRFGLAGGMCIGTPNALVDYYVTPASYKKHSICNFYHYHLFKKHKTSFLELKYYDHVMSSFLFNQKIFERDLRALPMLLTHPFNLISFIHFIKSSLNVNAIMKRSREAK